MIKSADQISIIDVTDAYSVILTSETHTFPGGTSAALAGSTTTQVIAMRGAEQVQATVDVSKIELRPNTLKGVTVTSNGVAPAPTLTISVTTATTAGGVIVVPVQIGDITIAKEFSFAIAFKGAAGPQGEKGDTGAAGKGVKTTAVTYQVSASGTSIPTGTWESSIPSVGAGQFLWTRTVITYTDNTTSTSYSVGMMGAKGDKGDTGGTGAAGKGVKSTAITYQKHTSGTTTPTGTWGSTIPAVGASEYLWTRTVITYTDNTTSTSYSVGMMGAKGDPGDKGVAVKAVYKYYLLRASTEAQPAAPTVYPPTGGWDDTEPAYTEGDTSNLYTVECTVLEDGSYSYTPVSLSSSYEAAKQAYIKAQEAQDSANNAQNSAGNAQTNANDAGGRASALEEMLQQLTDMIASLVVGTDGESLMTSTENEDGLPMWVFSIKEIVEALDAISDNLAELFEGDARLTSALDALTTTVSKLGKVTDAGVEIYSKSGTYSFNVADSGAQIRYGSNPVLQVEKEEVTLENLNVDGVINQSGFDWSRSSGGNLGVSWKGVTA
jgi:hypothetical protein